ncbi:MAG: type III-A CRISPR-associated RAMP protein Csm3 [Candidatus Diapherotrites archaeon]
MEYWKKEITIELITGLHIGGNKEDFEIGGTDNPVIKIKKKGINERVPYIPGSSIKGKMRSLLEIEKGIQKICDCGKCEICQVFGSAGNNEETKNMGSLIVRDFYLENEENYEEENTIELKAENFINRTSGKSTATPRLIERVIPGNSFKGEIIIRIVDPTKKEEYKKTVEKALELLEKDYLGGSGTRGYGQIKIKSKEWIKV